MKKTIIKEPIELEKIEDNRTLEFENVQSCEDEDIHRFKDGQIQQDKRKVRTLYSKEFDDEVFDI